MAIDQYWYSKNLVASLLLPLSWLFRLVSALRKYMYQFSVFSQHRLPVPVIVVGNINVGGTGKTPLVVALTKLLVDNDYQPGIITRGYGGEVKDTPVLVDEHSDAYEVSDEAVLLAKRSACPVAVSPDRIASSQLLLDQGCNIIISDDGLQHYRLQRDIEIAVIDGSRGLGNGYCLPAGPLREPAKRLSSVDFIITNGTSDKNYSQHDYLMRLFASRLRSLQDDEEQEASQFANTPVHAIAAIGNPKRFFNQLRDFGLNITEHAFADHYRYQAKDIEFNDDYAVIMTEKDAVKCRKIVDSNRYWYLPVDALVDDDFKQSFLEKLKTIRC